MSFSSDVLAFADPEKKPPESELDSPWLNDIHSSISNSVYESTKWFDDFFVEEDSENDIKNPKSQARIHLGWRPKRGDFSELKTRFRLKVRLPNLNNKVDLILSDEEGDEQSNLPLEGRVSNQNDADDHFSAALRFLKTKGKDSLLDSRVGISGGSIFARIRYSKKLQWADKHSFKFQPSVYYYLDDGLGEKLLLEYGYQKSTSHQYRVNYSIRGSESFSGIRWKHGFYHLTQISSKSASITGLKIEGERNGDDGFIIKKYTLSYRYRFNAIRKWLYFEVEPFVEFPEDDHYTTTPGIALRIEGFFRKKSSL